MVWRSNQKVSSFTTPHREFSVALLMLCWCSVVFLLGSLNQDVSNATTMCFLESIYLRLKHRKAKWELELLEHLTAKVFAYMNLQ